MSRKILISEGYGAGWVSWHSGSIEDKRKMLTWQPIIDALEAGEKITEDHPAVTSLWESLGKDEDFYAGGAHQLVIHEVPDGALVRVSEYDGYESFEITGEFEEWL